MATTVTAGRKVLAELRSASSAMSPALGRIATYVLAQPDQVLSLTVTELAEAAGSSEASVIRFCRDLDFESFQAFKLALATELAGLSTKASFEETGWSDLDAIADRAVTAVRETQDLQRRETIERLVQRLLKARRILTVGFGASAVTASYIQYKLTRLGIAAVMHSDPHMAAMSVAQMTGDDVVIAVSSSGSTIDAVRVADIARERGVFLSVLTNRVRSPLSS
ncbi:MAG: MurR/RpiR family transcriptional regulator, partial [Devosia sp.]